MVLGCKHPLGEMVQARIVYSTYVGDVVCIPRIRMGSNESKWPFKVKRKEFPLAIYFVMTINKNWGASLKEVGLYLLEQVFTQGQLYIALSRVTLREGLRILSLNKDSKVLNIVDNIICTEIFVATKNLNF